MIRIFYTQILHFEKTIDVSVGYSESDDTNFSIEAVLDGTNKNIFSKLNKDQLKDLNSKIIELIEIENDII